MQTFTYVARDGKTGEKVSAEIDASDEPTAAKLLVQRGLSPLEISSASNEESIISKLHNRVSTKQKVIFSRQLSTLLNAGLPLVQSLTAVQDQMSNPTLKQVVGVIIGEVEGGSSFADALAKHPNVFSEVYISLVAAGEASGTLDTSLERLANQQEKDAEIISKVRGALVYPLVVILVLIGVVIFMMTTVLPQVQSFYNGIPGAKLPFLTLALLALAHFIIHFWWLIIILLIVSGYLLANWARSDSGKSTLDELKIRSPIINQLFMKLYMTRFGRTASTLVASGVPMLKMLNTSADAVGNVHIADSIRQAAEQVKGGKSLSESLKDNPHFLPLVPDMIHTGEQSGQLEGMLGKLADYYEKEVDTQIKNVSTIIEPAMMIFVGIVALVIVAAVLLPIYSLAGKDLIHF
jgi:type IV pilus assembly protein PilC